MGRFSYYVEMLGKASVPVMAPKIWNYLKYRSLPRRPNVSIRAYTPQICSLHMTMRCNLNCSYCGVAKMYRETGRSWQESEANLEKIQQVFSSPLLANCLLVDLLGGEPLLVRDLEQIVSFLVGRGHLVNTSTNGILLLARVEALKRAGISRINVSLYKDNHDVVWRDLPAINKIFPVHTSMVLLRSDVMERSKEIRETIRFVQASGSCGLRFFMYRALGDAPRPQEIITAHDEAYRHLQEQVEVEFPGFCTWPLPVSSGRLLKRCPQLWQRINVDMLGNVGACCGVDTYLTGPNSNLFGTPPEVLFNHPVLVDMRRQMLDPAGDPPDVCKKCNLLGDPGW